MENKRESVFKTEKFEVPHSLGELDESPGGIGEAEKKIHNLMPEILEFGKELTHLTDTLGDVNITTLTAFLKERECEAVPFVPNLSFALLQMAARFRGMARGLWAGSEENWDKMNRPFEQIEQDERKFTEERLDSRKDSEDSGESS